MAPEPAAQGGRRRLPFPGVPLLCALGLCASLPGAAEAGGRTRVPSDPATWYGDFRDLVRSTAACPGGTVAGLAERVALSDPHAPRAFDSLRPGFLRSVRGIAKSDRVHSFRFEADLPDGSFRGFDGHLVVRGGCVVHAQVESIDN